MSEVIIKWGIEDVLHLRPNLTEGQAEKMLTAVSRPLKDRNIEEGWQILETLVSLVEKEGNK